MRVVATLEMSKVVEKALPSAVLRRGQDRCAEGAGAALARREKGSQEAVWERWLIGEDNMRQFWLALCLVGCVVGPAVAGAYELLPVEGGDAVEAAVSQQLTLPRPNGRTGALVLLDRATLPSAVRERWWDRIATMSRDGGFGRAARLIVDDPDPAGGLPVCDEAAIAPLIHADAQVILCTELSLSPRGTGALTLYAQGRTSEEEGWSYARRSVSVADFNFEGALAEALNGFFVATPQRGFAPPASKGVAPPRSEASRRGTPQATAPSAPSDVPNFGSTEIAEGSGGAPPSVTAALIVTSLIDDAFKASLDIGLGGQLSLALTGGGQSQSISGAELSTVILGAAVRGYFVEPMSGLYGSVGLSSVNVNISSEYFDSSAAVLMLQPSVGLKLTGAPGLAVGLEAGFNVMLSGESSFGDKASGVEVEPFGTGGGFLDVSVGLSF